MAFDVIWHFTHTHISRTVFIRSCFQVPLSNATNTKIKLMLDSS